MTCSCAQGSRQANLISGRRGATFTLSAGGDASWVLRHRHGGTQRELALGQHPRMTLATAHKEAARKQVGATQ